MNMYRDNQFSQLYPPVPVAQLADESARRAWQPVLFVYTYMLLPFFIDSQSAFYGTRTPLAYALLGVFLLLLRVHTIRRQRQDFASAL